MNITAVLALASYKKRDGTCAVVTRISRGKQTRDIPTGYLIKERCWDDSKREVKSSCEEVTSVAKLNRQIRDEFKRVNDILIDLDDRHILDTLPIGDVVKRVKKTNDDCFFAFADKVVLDLIQAKRVGTANAYADGIKAIENINGSRVLGFKDITVQFLRRMETAHFAKGNKANGLAAYLRSIRAIFNLAIDAGIIDAKYYPFKKYKINTERTQKRAISRELLQKIISTEIPASHPCYDARNKFLISYMLYGMNFFDLALLEKSNIVDGRIEYQRNKTTAPYNILITPALQTLLDIYISEESKYIFGIIKRETAELQYKDIENARRLFNDKLKDLAKLCGIQANLTSYVSRHSFATHAKLHKIPVEAISEMLGHTSIKTTQIYLDSLPSATLDEYNSRILGLYAESD